MTTVKIKSKSANFLDFTKPFKGFVKELDTGKVLLVVGDDGYPVSNYVFCYEISPVNSKIIRPDGGRGKTWEKKFAVAKPGDIFTWRKKLRQVLTLQEVQQYLHSEYELVDNWAISDPGMKVSTSGDNYFPD